LDSRSRRSIENNLLGIVGGITRRLSLLPVNPWQSAADKITTKVLGAPQTLPTTSQAFPNRDG
jgi:hypothetical protein